MTPTVFHVGLLGFDPAATDEQRRAVAEGLCALPGTVEGLVSVQAFPDAGLKEGNGDLAFVLGFADEDSWRAYQDHPAHQALVHERIRPILSTKAFVQSRAGEVRTGGAAS